MTDQVLGGPIPDVVTLRVRDKSKSAPGGGIAIAKAPPQARFVRSAEIDPYIGRANRIVIKHRLGEVVAVIEVVSPGNKNQRYAFRAFVEKPKEMLLDGIHLLVIDLFPPSPRDPQGIHKEIWDQIKDEPFELPPDKPLTVVAYFAGEPKAAYVDPVAVSDTLPPLPIFLDAETYVPAPLESTYMNTWEKSPAAVKQFVLGNAK